MAYNKVKKVDDSSSMDDLDDSDDLRLISRSELRRHDSKETSAWLSTLLPLARARRRNAKKKTHQTHTHKKGIDGVVYDVTKFLKFHPGGERVILRSAGKNDSTNDFEAVGHSDRARRMLRKYRIGKLRAVEDDDEEDVKIDIKDQHHHHHHHHGSKSDNIWLKDEPAGTKYIGKSGQRFCSICFGWTPAMVYMAPFEVELEPKEMEGLEKVYWAPQVFDKDSTIKVRRARAHASNRPWLVVFLSYLLITYGDFQLDSFTSILNLVTIILCSVALLSIPVLARCQGLRMIPRILVQLPIMICGVTFASILTLLIHIGCYGDLVTCRFAMTCIVSAFLILTFPISNVPKGMDGSWYFGKIRKRMELGHWMAFFPMLEMGILSRGGGLFGIFMGLTLGTLISYQNHLVTISARILRGRFGLLSCCIAISSALFSLLFRFIWSVSLSSSSSSSNENINDIRYFFMSEDGGIGLTKCMGVIVLVLLVQILLSNMVTVPGVDNVTAATHLQSMMGSFVIHLITLTWLFLCIIFGSNTLTYYGPAFLLTLFSFVIQNNYMTILTTNSVRNIDREPVGENCADICDDTLTLKVLQAEHGMSSLYACTSC